MKKVTSLLPSQSVQKHNGRGNRLTRVKPSAVSQATPDLQRHPKARTSDGVSEMAARVRKFQGPWNAIPHSTDDNIEGGY